MIKRLTTVMALLTIASVAEAQVITPVWVQRIAPWGTQGNGTNGTVLIGTDPANQFPLLAGSRPEPNNNEDGTEIQPVFNRLQRYDANRLLLFIGENGINETDPNITPAQQALAAAYPDRSAVWIDAATGKSLGLAWYGGLHPAMNCIPPYNVQDPSTGNQLPNYDPIYTFYFAAAVDEGPPGQKALYDGVNHIILRYAPLPDGSGWTNVPTIAYQEQVPGIGDGLSGAGDDFRRWRWRNFRVTGWGTNTVILGSGGTWRTGMHPQVLVTTDGLNFAPRGRVDTRSGGIRNNYAGDGMGSRVVKYGTDPVNPNVEVYYQGHYPAYAYPSETPERYVSDPDRFYPGQPSVATYNQQPNVAMFESTPGVSNVLSGVTNNLPLFQWEEAGKNGLLPADNTVDNVTRYSGSWNVDVDADSALDYVVTYSTPSWNNAYGGGKRSVGWIGIHRLDGSISPNSAYQIPLTEEDVRVPGNGGDGLVGNEAVYNGRVSVNPDTNAPANLKKAEILASFGPLGFGLFTVQNVPGGFYNLPPASLTLTEADPLSISCVVTGSPNTYVWSKNGVPLDGTVTNLDGSFRWPPTVVQGVKKANLYNASVVVSDSGTYTLTVTNPLSGTFSANVNVTVNPDTNKPTVVSVTALATPSLIAANPTLVKVLFSKRIDPTSGGNLANYNIPGASLVSVTLQSTAAAASLGADWREAIVATTGLTPGQTYNLTVSGVKDQSSAGNLINPVTVKFVVPVPVNGKLDWDYYYVGAGSLTAVYGSPIFPAAPMTNWYATSFDTTPITGGDLNNVPAFGALGDNYGDTLSGWITPTVTTNYYFFLASDDSSDLYLSFDDNPINYSTIAQETGCCHGFLEPGNSTESTVTSDPQYLVAGTRYFIRAVHSEGGGGDYVKVAWRMQGDTNTPAASLQPIPGTYLSSYQPPQFYPPVISGGQVTLTWAGSGTLLESTDLKIWTPVAGNPPSPYTFSANAANKFYRLSF